MRLRCREDALARIPWEFAAFAIDGMQRDGLFHVDRMLAMHPKVCLSRFDEISTPIERPSAGAARRQLLFVSAAPPDTRPLALGLERQRIEEALREAQTTPAAEWIEHITPRGLQQRLMNARIDVFQFSGHGGSSSGGYLCFEPDEDVATIEADQLALLLAGKGVRLAVLAACVTAEIESQLPWNSVARTLVAGGVPAVVGMQFNITDQGALAYLSTFYRALARSLTICDAVTEGRKSIVLNPRSARDFGVPVLYLRNADNWDGILFPPSSPVRDEGPIEANIRAADAYKRLHDALHTAKMSAFNLLLRFANDFPPKQAGGRTQLRSYGNTLKMCAREMRAIVGEGRCDKELVDPLVNAFDQALEELGIGIDTWNRDCFDDALPQLISIFGREMSKLDVSLVAKIKELPDSDAIALALGHAPDRADELVGMIEEMKLRVAQHHACQRLEDLLDDLRRVEVVNVRALSRRWNEVTATLESFLAALDHREADSLTDRSKRLHASLESPDVEVIALAYEDFCGEVGMSFYKIDSGLKGLCNRFCKDPRLAGFMVR